MKKTKLSVSAAILAFSSIVASCYTVLPEMQESSAEAAGTAHLNLRVTRNGATKSSISPDEDAIQNVCVMAYRQDDGRLAAMQTKESVGEIDLELTSGYYNIYVTANMGEFDAPVSEADMDEAGHTIRSLDDMEHALPMCWKGEAGLKAGENTTVYANLSRLVSKTAFKVEMGVLEGLEITSVRLCQGAGTIRPFMEGGSRILDPEEAVDGDYATQDDIRSLMGGETMYFYVTENCQGTLLPENTDPWEKVPESIGEKADLCTYVEMKGRWNDDADYAGEVTYRFYLGEDAAKSFDIRRNSLHNLTLYLEEESFDRISWKIDASMMEPVAWEAYSDLSNNFHDKDEFYFSEIIRMDLSIDERGQKYWKKRNNGFYLTGVDYDGNTIIRFDTPTDLGNGRFRAMGTCIGTGDYDILMMNSETGEIEYVMTDGTVHPPLVVAGNNGIFMDEPVEGFDDEIGFMINGRTYDICLYMTDKDGYNLNQGHYYGCDFSICSWHTDIVNGLHDHSLIDNATIQKFQGETGSDGYAIRYRLSFNNDGTDESWNRILTESLGRGMLGFTYEESTSGASGKYWMGLYCDDIRITFRPVPDNSKSILGTEFMYQVENPSNLPVKIRGLKLNSMGTEPFRYEIRPVICNTIPENTNTDLLLISRMPYTYCSLEEDASRSVIIDGKMCFAADDNGTEQSGLPDQLAMFHIFEARFSYGDDDIWTPDFIGDIDLYDTYKHSIMYGEDGFMNCGMILFAYDKKHESLDSYNGRRTDFTQYGKLLSREYIGKFDKTVEVDISINADNEITATASRDIELDISLSGNLKGHIRCVTVQDPFYTVWGRYFSHSQPFSHTCRIKLGQTPAVIDAAALSESFAKMRAVPYYSVLDAWDEDDFRNPYTMSGTIREYLKPYDIDLKIDITSPDGSPVAVRFSGSAQYDYKSSDPVTWQTGLFSSVTMVPSSHSGFDDRLDDDDCPAGALFKEEYLYLQPNVTYGNTQGIWYMTK